MNWDRVEGQWKQRRGKAVQHWGRLMNDELAAIAGKHEQLVGILQEKYGVAKEQAAKQIREFKAIIAQLKKSNANLAKLQRRKTKPAKKKPGASRSAPKKRKRSRKIV